MAALKTQQTEASVPKFLATIADPKRRAECETIARLMAEVTKAPAKLWGPSILGFGTRTIAYAGGRTGEWMQLGFSPRKAALTLYLTSGSAMHPELLAKLGPHKVGGGCLYLNGLEKTDLKALKALMAAVVKEMKSVPAAKPATKQATKAKTVKKSAVNTKVVKQKAVKKTSSPKKKASK